MPSAWCCGACEDEGLRVSDRQMFSDCILSNNEDSTGIFSS